MEEDCIHQEYLEFHLLTYHKESKRPAFLQWEKHKKSKDTIVLMIFRETIMIIWNPWHGCKKLSPGCMHCYVYRRDESIGKDASVVSKTGEFDLPLRRNRQKEYKLQPEDGTVFCCMTSDFFLKEADDWREECWDIIRTLRSVAPAKTRTERTIESRFFLMLRSGIVRLSRSRCWKKFILKNISKAG